jgi:hypothetical protein
MRICNILSTARAPKWFEPYLWSQSSAGLIIKDFLLSDRSKTTQVCTKLCTNCLRKALGSHNAFISIRVAAQKLITVFGSSHVAWKGEREETILAL